MQDYLVFREKSITFYFSPKYKVLKYDQSDFYRNTIIKIQHTEAVDYILKDNNKLIFIEISDYRNQTPPKHHELVDEVIQKVKDSIIGLYSARINQEQGLVEYYDILFNNTIEEFSVVFLLEEDSTRLHNSANKRINMAMRLESKLREIFKAQFYICNSSDYQELAQKIDFQIQSI